MACLRASALGVTLPGASLVRRGIARQIRDGRRDLPSAAGRNSRQAEETPPAGSARASVMPRHNVLVVDNYDSFVYNIVQYLGQLGAEPGRAS